MEYIPNSRFKNDFMFCFCLFDGFNATFNNISAISLGSVLLVEETTDLSEVPDNLYHIMLHASKAFNLEHRDNTKPGERRDCVRMVVGFTTTYAIRAYRH
jgi:hypothetical protein